MNSLDDFSDNFSKSLRPSTSNQDESGDEDDDENGYDASGRKRPGLNEFDRDSKV